MGGSSRFFARRSARLGFCAAFASGADSGASRSGASSSFANIAGGLGLYALFLALGGIGSLSDGAGGGGGGGAATSGVGGFATAGGGAGSGGGSERSSSKSSASIASSVSKGSSRSSSAASFSISAAASSSGVLARASAGGSCSCDSASMSSSRSERSRSMPLGLWLVAGGLVGTPERAAAADTRSSVMSAICVATSSSSPSESKSAKLGYFFRSSSGESRGPRGAGAVPGLERFSRSSRARFSSSGSGR